MPDPFDGLTPAPSHDHAHWVVAAMAGREGVALVVPERFEAYARIHHRIHNGETWADFAPEYLVRGREMYDYLGTKLEFIDGDGNLDDDSVDALVPMLGASTATPARCHYALWQGWGWVDAVDEEMAPVRQFAAACPVEPWWGGRDMILFDGPIDAVATIGHRVRPETTIHRQCPQWWWAQDRSWFVGTEIEHAWSYVAGARALVDEVLASPQWESVAVEPTDRW